MTKLLIAYAHGGTDESILNQISKIHIDRRYIYIGMKIHLLFPGVEDALRDLLLNPMDLAKLIDAAKNDAVLRGKVLKYAILKYYTGLSSKRKQCYDLTEIFNPEANLCLHDLFLTFILLLSYIKSSISSCSKNFNLIFICLVLIKKFQGKLRKLFLVSYYILFVY